jgi:hypothetical protein
MKLSGIRRIKMAVCLVLIIVVVIAVALHTRDRLVAMFTLGLDI